MARSTVYDRHAARVLLVLGALEDHGITTDNLSVISSLDFIVRYPQQLILLAASHGVGVESAAQPTEVEQLSLERLAARYKYTVSQSQYMPILGVLIGLNLVEKLPREYRVTLLGKSVAVRIGSTREWVPVAGRARAGAELQKLLGPSLVSNLRASLPESYVETETPA